MKFRLINWIIVMVALSSVVSAGIVDSYATGEFGAPGFRARDDVLSFVARVFVGGDNLISSGQVQWRNAGVGAWTNFNSCIATTTAGVFDCYYVAGANDVVTSDSKSYEIRLTTDGNSLVETKSVSIIVDVLSPIVSGVDFKQDSSGLKVTYSLSDKACNSAVCAGKCSSIRRVDIFENDALIDTVEAGNTECSVSTSTNFKPSGTPVFGGLMRTYKAKFYDGAGNSVDGGVSRNVFVDNYLPVVNEDSFKLIDSVTGRVVHGFKSGESGRGVSGEIVVSDDFGVSKAVVDFYGTKYTAACTLVGGSDYRCTWSSLGILDSANTIGGFFVDAYDKGGNVQRIFANYPIAIEKTGPSLVDFKLTKDGHEINLLGSSPSGVVLNARILEEYPGLGSVTLNVNGAAYSPNCVDSGYGLYDCQVTLLSVTNSGSITVSFTGTDTAGNSGSGSLTKNYNVDSSVPIITYLGSEHRGKVSTTYESYLGSDSSKVIAEISEDAFDSALLSVNGANPVSGTCNLVSAGRNLCSWTIGNYNTGDVVSLQVNVKDKAGNVGTRTSSMYVDKVAPTVSLVDVLSLDGDIKTAVHKVGDYLVISADVSDDSPVHVEYDFRGIGYSSIGSSDCSSSGDKKWNCEVVVDPIPTLFGSDGSLGGISGPISIKIVDAVGNSIDASTLQVGAGIERNAGSLSLSALRPDDNFNPNFWRATVGSSSPSALDRVLATKTYQRIGFSLRLDKIQSNSPVTIGDVIVYKCSDDLGVYSNQQVYNGQSVNPTVMIEISKLNEDQTLNLDSSVITCDLGIISKNGNVVYKPEIEKVNLTIKYFNTPLGVVDDRLASKIESAKKSFAGPDSDLGKTLKQLKQISTFAEGTCKTLGTIDKIRQVWNGIDVLSGLAFETAGAPQPAKCAENEAFNTGFKDTVWTAQNTFCKVMSCSSPIGDLFGDEPATTTTPPATTETTATTPTKAPELPPFTGFRNWNTDGITNKQAGSYIDRKSNLIAAMIPSPYVCIPGIINGLEEYRQLECGYIDCLQSQVPLGIPIEACDSSRAVGMCRYIVGDVTEMLFLLHPYTAMWNQWFTLAQTAIQDPLSTVGLGLSFVCASTCSEGSAPHGACVALKYASLVGSLANDLKAMKENSPFSAKDDICKKI